MLIIQGHRERGMVRLTSCCTCLAFFALVFAAIFPMFVVTSLKGHGKLFVAEFDVDLAIGDGLWKRNVCYGGSRPDEDVLKQFGLTCTGTLQRAHCDDENLSQKDEDRCDDYLVMQSMEGLAIFSVFTASFLGTLARACNTNKVLGCTVRLATMVCLLAAIASAAAVVTLVRESDMGENENNFSCSTMLGAELCHGYGPSFALQVTAIANLGVALLLHFVLLFVPSTEQTTTYQYIQAPLLPHGSQGVVISAPQGYAPRFAAAEAV